MDSSFIVDTSNVLDKPITQQRSLAPLSSSEARKHIRRTIQQILNAWQADQIDRMADRFVGEDGETLSAEQIKPSLDAYEAVHGRFRLTPALRDNSSLTIREDAAQVWKPLVSTSGTMPQTMIGISLVA